ncbi:hypothetical protein CAC42_3944 [Sphaceloma murrayae]|uniref:Dynein light intermediate chain n=1 Tax=Sphaceloma murrayae TaxID=2082308 RepID=A0A2K1QSF8_9PEZI|nr:hypothetical protein CAC42_3944 [Sphaceloma murrayae]
MASTLQPRHTSHVRNPSSTAPRKELWSTLLTTVASSKTIPSKQLLLLGGNPSSQSDLITALAPLPTQASRRDRSARSQVPLANTHARGYTYRDLTSSDGEDTLARLGIYTLPDPSSSYAPLLARLLSPSTIPNSTAVILLDWSAPWTFIPLLRQWVHLLKSALATLPATSQHLLEDNNTRWTKRRDADAATSIAEAGTTTPLGPGEFDDALGLPITIVVGNTQAMENLEKRGWKEGEFDFVLQFLRTVGLKMGAGIVYAGPGMGAEIRAISLRGLEVQEEKGMVKHNVVDRERVVVPPGWDSWGKIRVLREGFDIEGVSRAWGADIQGPRGSIEGEQDTSVETLYAAKISNPRPENHSTPRIEVEHTPDQTFLATQLERLDTFRSEDEAARKQRSQSRRTNTMDDTSARPSMNEQIGPVQFNMGGIQYDADEALKRIKARTKQDSTQAGTPERARTRETTPYTPGSPPQFEPGKDIPTENLEAYFASLIKGRGGSVQNSPRVGSPRVVQKTPGESSGAGTGSGTGNSS